MDKTTILSIVSDELSNASSAYESYVEGNIEDALDYYLGNPRGDEKEGRSQVISTDVADAVEWIMPQIIESLVKGPVIHFDAVSEQDEVQAELETDFTHSVFMQENNGFLNLYQFVKDCLLAKNGILKIWYDDTPEESVEHYDGLSDQEVLSLEMDPDVEITERTEEILLTTMGQEKITAVTAVRYCRQGRVKVVSVPPEEFMVAAGHDSLDLSDARFVAHRTNRTASDLIEEGYPKEIIDKAVYSDVDDEFRFTSQGEDYLENDSLDPSQKRIEVTECYMKMDVNEDGVSELMRLVVLTSGEAYDILEMDEIDVIPFVSSTAIIMPHKFYGLSIYDRLKQIQDQKTSLWRNILDNLYLQNNREKEVVEGQVNLDDLLVSRPGGIKRVKQPGMIRELAVQPIGRESYDMLQYLDGVRSGRVGVSPDSQGQEFLLSSDTAHGIERLMTAKEKLVGLMVRVIAETGLRQAYKRVRDLLVKHQNSVTAYKFRNQWINVNPALWGKRSRISVTVGTGNGDEQKRQAAIQAVLMFQEKIMQNPDQTLVDEKHIYAALDDLADASGLNGADGYFRDPSSPEGMQVKQQKAQEAQQMQQVQQQAQQALTQAQQQLAQAETMKGQAAIQAQQVKMQAEQAKIQAEIQKANYEAQIDQLKVQIDQMKARMEQMQEDEKIRYQYAKLASDEALKLTELEISANRDLSQQNEDNKEEEDDETYIQVVDA